MARPGLLPGAPCWQRSHLLSTVNGMQDRALTRAERWASTMAGQAVDATVHQAHAGSDSVQVGASTVVDRAAREAAEAAVAGSGSDPGRRGRAAGASGGARPVADLLRAGPGPDPALHRLPAPGRQDPGLHLPRRPPTHPPDPRPGGGAGRHGHRPGLPAQRRPGGGHRPGPRLRSRSGGPRLRGRPDGRSSPTSTTPYGAQM